MRILQRATRNGISNETSGLHFYLEILPIFHFQQKFLNNLFNIIKNEWYKRDHIKGQSGMPHRRLK